MDNTLHLAAIRRATTCRLGVIGTTQLDNIASLILYNLLTLNEISIPQAHLTTGAKTIVTLGGLLHKVGLLDENLPTKGNLPTTGSLILGVVHTAEDLALTLGVVGNNHLQGVDNCHAALGNLIKILPHAILKQREVDNIIPLGHTHLLGESADRRGSVALATQCANGGHSGVIPTRNHLVFNQLEQFTLTHHRIGKVEPCELILVAGENTELLNEPIVQGAVNIKFEGTNRVCNPLDGVALTVCVVVHGVDTPLVAGAMVLGVENTVEDGVAEEHIGVGHVNLGTQHLLAVGILTLLHLLKELEVLLHRAISPRALCTCLLHRAATETNLLLSLVIHIGLTLLDELHGPLIELVEVVGCIALHSPIEAEPLDILLDGIHILGILLHGVGVVETEVTLTVVTLCEAKVKANTLGVANMEIAVGLGREAGLDGASCLGNIVFNNLFYEIEAPLFGCLGGLYFHNTKT